MWAKHPDIARRWTQEFGSGGKGLPQHVSGSGTPSNESPNPRVAKLPRVPAGKRDFGGLHPSQSHRFAPKHSPHPNEAEAESEGHGVEHQHGSYKPHKMKLAPATPTGLLARDVNKAMSGLRRST